MKEQVNFYTQKLQFEIDSWDLSEEMKKATGPVVLDTRSEEAYKQEHIPSAVNFPHRSMNEQTTSHLDKDKLYVTYCDGIGCNASTKGALNLAKLGFQVKELMGGLDWWKRDGHTTEGSKVSAGNDISCGC